MSNSGSIKVARRASTRKGRRLLLLQPLLRILLWTLGAFLFFGAIAVSLGREVATYIVQISVLLYLCSRAGKTLKDPRQRVLVRGIRPRHFGMALPVLGCTLLAVAVLLVPSGPLRWGWWEALGGSGNVFLGQTGNPRSVISALVLPALIVLALASSLCRLALQEERMFRRGDEARGLGSRLWRSFVFGLAHLVVGIPVGAAIGLGVGGFGFSQVYLRQWRRSTSRYRSVLDAARVHAVYNLIIVALLVAVLIEAAGSSARTSSASRPSSRWSRAAHPDALERRRAAILGSAPEHER